MLRYLGSVPSAWSAERVFAYMADARNFAAWDPGTRRVTQVQGDGPSERAVYDVEATVGRRTSTFRYHVVEWNPPVSIMFHARGTALSLHDRVMIRPDEGGAVVTYEARLQLRGVRRLFEPLLGPFFRRTGDRGAAGLRATLGREPKESSG